MEKEKLPDLGALPLDPGVPLELRAAYILKAAGSPDRFRVGDVGVELRFTDGAPPLQEALAGFFLRDKGEV